MKIDEEISRSTMSAVSKSGDLTNDYVNGHELMARLISNRKLNEFSYSVIAYAAENKLKYICGEESAGNSLAYFISALSTTWPTPLIPFM